MAHSNGEVLLVTLLGKEDLLSLGDRGEDEGLAVLVTLEVSVSAAAGGSQQKHTHVGTDTEVDLLGRGVGLEVLSDTKDGVGGAVDGASAAAATAAALAVGGRPGWVLESTRVGGGRPTTKRQTTYPALTEAQTETERAMAGVPRRRRAVRVAAVSIVERCVREMWGWRDEREREMRWLYTTVPPSCLPRLARLGDARKATVSGNLLSRGLCQEIVPERFLPWTHIQMGLDKMQYTIYPR